MTVLHIDASARHDGSTSRTLSLELVDALRQAGDTVVYRDVGAGLPLLTGEMIGSYFTPPADRSEDQKAAIALSDELVAELQAADTIVFGVPVYNYGAPAAFKAWADLVARVGVTFRYTENGPVGLLEGKKAYLVVATGGTKVDSPIDFFTPWARQFLGFLGIKDVEVLAADALMADADGKIAEVRETIAGLKQAA
jgi:FMN-dependent NADH-azoreductase